MIGAPQRRGRRVPMAEINVTPMVDVMLVLLIIFMVTAPLLVTGVPVDLPASKAATLKADDKPREGRAGIAVQVCSTAARHSTIQQTKKQYNERMSGGGGRTTQQLGKRVSLAGWLAGSLADC